MRKRLLIFPFLLLFLASLQAQKAKVPSVPVNKESVPQEIDRKELLTTAKEYLGTPYRRGSMDPKKGFDCSGFVCFVFKKFNVTLPRSSGEYKNLRRALKPEEFQIGDILVFYGYKDKSHIGHLGIICEANGMKSKFIHSSSGKAYGVTISNLDSKGYKRRFYKSIDVIKSPGKSD
ncbi:MAG: C40 family peptidase [Bacteroidota bacterium]